MQNAWAAYGISGAAIGMVKDVQKMSKMMQMFGILTIKKRKKGKKMDGNKTDGGK